MGWGGGRGGGGGCRLVGAKDKKKKKLLGLGKESSGRIIKPNSKQLESVDWLSDCVRASRSLPVFQENPPN